MNMPDEDVSEKRPPRVYEAGSTFEEVRKFTKNLPRASDEETKEKMPFYIRLPKKSERAR